MSEQVATRNTRRIATGVVTSDKMDKTIVVETRHQARHPLYEKRVRRKIVYSVHDENNDAHEGDTVEIMETRKLSKTKCWRLVRVLKRKE